MRLKKNAGESEKGVIKVRSWTEFKQLAGSLRPEAMSTIPSRMDYRRKGS